MTAKKKLPKKSSAHKSRPAKERPQPKESQLSQPESPALVEASTSTTPKTEPPTSELPSSDTETKKETSSSTELSSTATLPTPEPKQEPAAAVQEPAAAVQEPAKSQPEKANSQSEATPEPATPTKIVQNAPDHPQGPGIMAITKDGTPVEVLGLDQRYPGEVWCKVMARDGQSWRNHYHMEALVITDEVYRFLNGDKPRDDFKTPAGRDRWGLTYEGCVAEQEEQLALLEFVLEGAELMKLRKWCKNENKPVVEANRQHASHNVPRGMTLLGRLFKRAEFVRDMG